MKKLLCYALGLAGMLSACDQQPPPPAPYGAVPTEHQMEWQKMEYYMFIHFGPNTFTDVEWGDGKEDPKVFNPTQLDCRQWASIAKNAGMTGIIITAKHHDGFCLWPSNYSTHTVRESPWKDGKGDVLKELSEACKEYGLKFGVYLSPWDQNHPAYGTPEYNQIFANTLTEVLTGYGHVYEQWFDGANGEGPNGKKQEYDWDLFHETVYSHQPHAIIFSDIGPGARWMGNERGIAGETNWSTLNVKGFGRGHDAPSTQVLNNGNMNGEAWVPAETDVSIRPGWFYSPRTNDKVKSLEHLVDIYYTSVGRNSNLLLNVPPDQRGLIHPNDSARLMEFKKAIDEEFAVNLMKDVKLTAQHTRGNATAYSVENLVNGNYESYWTTDDDVKQTSIEIELPQQEAFNRFMAQEYIPLGQRVAAFSVEVWNEADSKWVLVKDATTIGYKRILRFPTVQAKKIRLNIKESLACPVLSNIAIYRAPETGSLGDDMSITLSPKATNWKAYTNSQKDLKAVIDGKINTVATPSGELIIDLAEVADIKGFYYIPSTNNGANHIVRYNFSISNDGKSWTKLKDNTPFNNIRNNPIRQDVLLDNPVKAKFVKIEALETTANKNAYDVAEFGPVTAKN